MSDEWNIYPCSMGGKIAWVFYDHGINETLDREAPDQLLVIVVALLKPTAQGLPSQQESVSLNELEDDLLELLRSHSGLYVGRITVDGHRYLHVFVAGTEAEWHRRLSPIGERHGHALKLIAKSDPEHTGYWQDLFPDDDSWQVIMDLRVLDALAKEGDDGTTVRQVDHWAYFREPDATQAFGSWLAERGYRVDSIEVDDGRHRIRFFHETAVDLESITRHSIALRRKAVALGGEYDGWETAVCGPE